MKAPRRRASRWLAVGSMLAIGCTAGTPPPVVVSTPHQSHPPSAAATLIGIVAVAPADELLFPARLLICSDLPLGYPSRRAGARAGDRRARAKPEVANRRRGRGAAAQAELLTRFGCELAQGYLFSHPVEADVLTGVLRRSVQQPAGELRAAPAGTALQFLI